jgi:hypothetical protein
MFCRGLKLSLRLSATFATSTVNFVVFLLKNVTYGYIPYISFLQSWYLNAIIFYIKLNQVEWYVLLNFCHIMILGLHPLAIFIFFLITVNVIINFQLPVGDFFSADIYTFLVYIFSAIHKSLNVKYKKLFIFSNLDPFLR